MIQGLYEQQVFAYYHSHLFLPWGEGQHNFNLALGLD